VLGAVLGVLFAVVAMPIAGVAMLSVHSRQSFGVWDPRSQPVRIKYCGRTYNGGAGGTSSLREQAISGVDPGSHSVWREVGTTDADVPYYAMVMPDSVRRRFSPPLPCTMAVYLRVGDDAYAPYILSGGP